MPPSSFKDPFDVALSRRARWAGDAPIASVLMARTLAQPELVSLAAGFVDQETLPVTPVAEALAALLESHEGARAALQYGTTAGYLPLREAIVERLLAADRVARHEVALSVEQVVLTAGSNQLLHLVLESLLDPGDVVLCGAPGYFVILGTLANLGARAVGVATDDEGIVPEALEEEFSRRREAGDLGRVKAVYAVSDFDNPTGATLPAERRAALVEIVRRWSRDRKLYLIEDAAYRELRYYGDDLPSIRSHDPRGEHVVLAGTFSKAFSPGIRVGWGILPEELVAPVMSQKGNIDFGSPNFNQHIMATVLERSLLDVHLTALRAAYRRKIDAVLEAAEAHLRAVAGVNWIRPTGGLYVWVRLPEGLDAGLDGPLFDRAVEEGVLYVPGHYCYPPEGEPMARNALRLSFGIPSCEAIRRGVAALARAISASLEGTA